MSLCLCVNASAAELTVTVRTGAKPIFGSAVTLYAAGETRGAFARPLGGGLTDASGKVRITYSPPSTTTLLYLLADRAPSAAVRLAAVLSLPSVAQSSITVNELTTVATAYVMAQFLKGETIAGHPASLRLAATMARNLVTPATGEVGRFFAGQAALGLFNTVANLLASCVQMKEPESCRDILSEAKTPGTAMPVNTLDAALSIARNPAHNVVPLYLLAPRNQPYSPSLGNSPEAWTLSIRYQVDAPGNLAVDEDGNVWIVNTGADPPLVKLTPSGATTPYGSGAPGGSGISIDTRGRVWAGRQDSVAVFDYSGEALSPPNGLRHPRIKRPQGIQSDQCGDVWIASDGGANLARFTDSEAARAATWSELDIRGAFAIAVDGSGDIWTTGIGNNRIAKVDRNGKPALGSAFIIRGIDKPIAIASDSLGNVWVSNHDSRTVTMIRPDGQEARHFTTPGIESPWGIAVDSNDNIFVASHKRPSLNILCGARPASCPLGMQTGEPISPPKGYTASGLTRPAGVAIDAAGNVWVANQTSVVAFIGLAAPVATPLIGPPRSPGQPLPVCGAKQ